MSSTDFDTAYDSIISRVATLLSGHTRLRDSYNIEENPEAFLVKGWGLSIEEGGFNTNRLLGPHRTTNINFGLTITRKRFALDTDPASKANADKNLLEDLRVIIDDIWQNNFNISGSPIIKFTNFTGISQIKTEKNSYLKVKMNIGVEYIIV